MEIPVDSNGTPNPDQPPNKRRRKKSMVWEYFRIETVSADCTRAYCKQCNKSFAYMSGSKLSGTSHLKRHITLGICPVTRSNNQEKSQMLVPCTNGFQNGSASAPPKKRYREAPRSVSVPFNQERCNHELAKMIVLHDYPLHMVDHVGFIDFTQTLQPKFNVANFDNIQRECISLYLREKQNLLKLLLAIPGRVSLTLDMWTSDQSIGYAILTGHFIDAEWVLHRHIFNVVKVPFPESGVAFNDAVVSCLSGWGLGSRLFSLTLDESFASESVVGNLKSLLAINNHMLNQKAKYIIRNCYAHVLSRLAQEAIGPLNAIVDKVRQNVRYVKSSKTRAEEFARLKEQLQVPSTKTLVLDNQRKWDSTYHMLSAASELKEVFCCLDTYDPDYKEAPFMFEWRQIDTLCVYLKLFYDAAEISTASTYPTANKFFLEVCKIQLELTHAARSPDPLISNLIRPLHEKFDKYWQDCSQVLAMAVVMDPRYKAKPVEFNFFKIYGDDCEASLKVRNVLDSISERFFEYLAQTLPLPSIDVEQRHEGYVKAEPLQDGTLLSSGDGLSDFDVYISEISGNQPTRSELDQYLEDSLWPRDDKSFDVLEWWKLHRIKYPNLSKVAADILSIPFATVDPYSVFDVASKRLDNYRCSLRPGILEALVCAKDWLQTFPVQGDRLQPVTLHESSDLSSAVV